MAAEDLGRLFDDDEMPPRLREQGKKLITGKVAESVTFLHAAVDRLAGIIDALLRLSRAGRVQYQWQTLEVGAIVQKVVDALHDSIKSKQAEITVDFLPDAWGDPTAVEQIFANLLDNAVPYLDPARPGRIEVGSVPPDWGDNLSDLQRLLCQRQRTGHSASVSGPDLHGVQSPASRRGTGRRDRARAWCAGWSSATADRSGSNRTPVWAQRFSSLCPPRPSKACSFLARHKNSERHPTRKALRNDNRTDLDRARRG